VDPHRRAARFGCELRGRRNRPARGERPRGRDRTRVADGSGAGAPGCILLLEELDGTTVTRSWGASATDPIDYAATEGTLSTCDSDALEPYTLESAFVVADDASDDLGLAVTVSSELPRYLRFRL